MALVEGSFPTPMKSIPSSTLSRFLSHPESAGSPSEQVAQGARKVSAHDLAGLVNLLPLIADKATRAVKSIHLRRRLDQLARYFVETERQGATEARREVAFGLFYFLKGHDVIPDTVPELGFLDDALLVEAVVARNQHELQAHWASRARA